MKLLLVILSSLLISGCNLGALAVGADIAGVVVDWVKPNTSVTYNIIHPESMTVSKDRCNDSIRDSYGGTCKNSTRNLLKLDENIDY